MQVTTNFSLETLTRSTRAMRLGLNNTPDAEQTEALRLLAEKVLEPMQGKLGRKVEVLSGFRSQGLNAQTPGSAVHSQHSKGEAVDLVVEGVEPPHLARWLVKLSGLVFDQLILEFAEQNKPGSGWVHVSYRKTGNRAEVLTATRGKKAVTAEGQEVWEVTQYSPGLPKWVPQNVPGDVRRAW